MSDFPQKINNSYESGSSSSSASSLNEQGLDRSIPFEEMEANKLAELLAPEPLNANTSAEEGIFPNVMNYQEMIEVPSYEPNYDYNIEYTNSPLVYSWLPIVPGFNENGLDNLHNFQHISNEKFLSDNVSSSSNESESISNQNVKYHEYLVINHFGQQLLNNHTRMNFHNLENSCNAMDLNISCAETSVSDPDLSFNDLSSKIFELQPKRKSCELKKEDQKDDNNLPLQPKKEDPAKLDQKEKEELPLVEKSKPKDFANSGAVEVNRSELMAVEPSECENPEQIRPNQDEESEEQRLHNESFEQLKKEDSSKMLYINEKSPDLFESEGEAPTDNEARDESEVLMEIIKPSGDCADSILNKLRSSLSGLCPPPRHQLSLPEMIETYKKNLAENPPPKSTVTSNSFFVPTHNPQEVVAMEWPNLAAAKFLDIAYNKSTTSEDIEVMCLSFGQRYIGAETASSFNHKIGPSSAKKRMEKLKLLKQSPGRRLSHLAHRRSIFSSANLKSSSQNPSQSSSVSGPKLIDKAKLYSKAKASKPKSPKKHASAKKKTPGKRKTPKSAKRFNIANPEPSSRASSKRALFTSPVDSHNSQKLIMIPKEIPEPRDKLPRRSLFSSINDENKKRRSSISPDQDAENRGSKFRRIESPTRMPKSQSFSIAPSTSSISINDSFKKTMLYRTQSEMIPQPSGSNNTLGYARHFTDDVKNKLLWSVSSALKSKQILKENEKFKAYAGLLAKLVKRIFLEFYDPTKKSISDQMMKFANQMVFFVIQERTFEEIYKTIKSSLQSKNTTKIVGYIGQQDYEKAQHHLVRKSSSFLLMSQSCSSLNLSQQSEKSLENSFPNSSRTSGSNSSINQSSSKNNVMSALRENYMNQSGEKSAKKFGGSESNLNNSKSGSSSSLMKAKRQISF